MYIKRHCNNFIFIIVFSFGMLLVELITLHPPFYQYESIQVAEMLLAGLCFFFSFFFPGFKYIYLYMFFIGQRPELPKNLPADMDSIVKFIHQCTEFDSEKRPTAQQAVAQLTKILKETLGGTKTTPH